MLEQRAPNHSDQVPAGMVSRWAWVLDPPARPGPPGAGDAPVDPQRGIPSLDGLRAISISLVLLAHLGGTRWFPIPQGATSFFALGALGVKVFFVISGFLITKLLLEEIEQHGTISLRRFYLRRTMRIFPPYYVFLAVLGIAALLGAAELNGRDFWQAITYTSNYNPGRDWNVGHTWSLAVEEQFYLIWPALLVLLGRRSGLKGVLLFILVAPLIRVGIWYLTPSYRVGIGNTFETVADALACGCLLAGVRDTLWARERVRHFLASPWVVASATALILFFASLDRPRTDALFGAAASNVAIAIVLEHYVRFPQSAVGRFLNRPSVRYVGVLSYSLYLWQQLFLNRESDSVFAAFPLNILLVATAAVASYYLVERPFLRLRRSLEQRLGRGASTHRGRAPGVAGAPTAGSAEPLEVGR